MSALSIIFLGTSGAVPSAGRYLSCTVCVREGELLFFDCGEGAQFQVLKHKVGLNRKTKIFVTHLHADHILGIPGLLHTMKLLGRTKDIQIFGPEGIKFLIEAFSEVTHLDPPFKIVITEIKNPEESPVIYETEQYHVEVTPVDHGETPCFAYALVEIPKPGKFNVERAKELGIPEGRLWGMLQKGLSVKVGEKTINPEDVLAPSKPGRKIVFCGDTRPIKSLVEFTKDATALIHEATYKEEHKNKAQEYFHSTASEAATIAKEAGVKLLLLTHFSSRYQDEDLDQLLMEAKKVFEKTILATDDMVIQIPLEDSKKFKIGYL